MASLVPVTVERLGAAFGKLPGIGPKTAQRLAFHCLRAPAEQVTALANALLAVQEVVTVCPTCFFIAEGGVCPVCSDARRDPSIVCVVEDAMDVLAIERSGEFRGMYHVLGGSLSPLEGRGPESLHLAELEARIQDGNVAELVVATDPDVEGEATAHYVARRFGQRGVTVSRLAHGLPAGGALQYADEVTVARAFSGRHPV